MTRRHLPTYQKTAKIASDDYPELLEVLEERPPHARALPTNRKTALKAPPADAHRLPPPNEDEWVQEMRPFVAFWHVMADSNDGGYNEPDWDEAGYTFGPSTRDSDMDPDMDSGMSGVVAAWEDVQQKAHDIFKIGGVHVLAVTDNTVAADVLGDHGTYQSSLQFESGSSGRARPVALWDCTCPWALYSFGRSGRWKKYEGRMCSHALALMLQYQSSPTEGLSPNAGEGDWDTDKITYSEPSKPSEWRVGSMENEAIPTLTTGNPAPGEDIAREWATVPAAGASELGNEIQVISAAYRDMPVLDESVADLWIEAALMFQMIAADLSKEWDIQVLDTDPYATAEEMFEDMRKGVYKVTTLHSNHPVWSVDDNVKFRIVHDITGHWESGGDFSFTGETMAYQGQCKHLPEHLWPVIFTEVVAQSAYANVHHLFGEQKVGLIKYTPEEAAAFVGKVLDGPRPDDYLHVSASLDFSALLTIRDECKADDSFGYCSGVSEIIEDQFGFPQVWGCFVQNGEKIDHFWNMLPDGRILDMTSDQFGIEPYLVTSAADSRYMAGEESDFSKSSTIGVSLEEFLKTADLRGCMWCHQNIHPTLTGQWADDSETTICPAKEWAGPQQQHKPTPTAEENRALKQHMRNFDRKLDRRRKKMADVWDNDGMGTDQNAQPEVGSLDAPEEPEAALPSTEGDFVPGDDRLAHLNSAGPSDGDIASAARDYLEKAGVKTFTFAEQQALIKEGEDVVASNLDRLDITGTHYEALEAQLAQAERTGESVLWWD